MMGPPTKPTEHMAMLLLTQHGLGMICVGHMVKHVRACKKPELLINVMQYL